MTKTKAIDKIKKLLALAEERNDSENIVEQALLKAQQLMARFDLEESDVEQSENNKVVSELVYGGGKMAGYNIEVALVICRHFRVEPIKSIRNGKSLFVLIGLKEDVEICEFVLRYTLNAFSKLAKKAIAQFKKENPHIPVSRRTSAEVKGDYCLGFCEGLRKKFEAQEVASTECSLMLVKDQLVVDYITKKTRGSCKVTTPRRMNLNAYEAGLDGGRSLDLNKSLV